MQIAAAYQWLVIELVQFSVLIHGEVTLDLLLVNDARGQRLFRHLLIFLHVFDFFNKRVFDKTIRSRFSLFSTFSIQLTVYKFFQWLDSNRGPLLMEATDLTTEPNLCSNH